MTILERQAEAGRKILVSGGTRWCASPHLPLSSSLQEDLPSKRIRDIGPQPVALSLASTTTDRHCTNAVPMTHCNCSCCAAAAMCCRRTWTRAATSSRNPALQRCAACLPPGPWTSAGPGACALPLTDRLSGTWCCCDVMLLPLGDVVPQVWLPQAQLLAAVDGNSDDAGSREMPHDMRS